MKPTRWAAALAACVLAVPAMAERTGPDALRAQRRHAPAVERGLLPQQATESPFSGDIGLKVARDDSHTNAWTTPYELDYGTDGSPWSFSVSGDGLSRVSSRGDGRRSGFGDVDVGVAYAIDPHLSLAATLTLPTHGDVGSEHASQTFQAVYVSPSFGPWKLSFVATAVRAGGDAPDGRWSRGLYGEAALELPGGCIGTASLTRAQPASGSGTTTLGASLEVPLAASAWKLVLELTRDVAGENRATGGSATLRWSF